MQFASTHLSLYILNPLRFQQARAVAEPADAGELGERNPQGRERKKMTRAKVMATKKSDIYRSLWESCDQLRGGMDASLYKDYILTLLFVK